jgi:hypothetical protein
MSLLPFLDSFDHYNSAHSAQKWGSSLVIVPGAGRRGTQAALLDPNLKTVALTPLTLGTLYMGGAYKDPANTPFRVTNLVSGAMAGMQCAGDGRFYMIGIDPTALFQSFVGSNATPPILGGRYYYLEFRADITPNNISVEMRINEQLVLSETKVLSSTITVPHGAEWHTFSVQGSNSFLDDFYVDDTGYFGDIDVLCSRPAARGSSTMWVPSPSGNANWFNVSDVIPDDNVTTVDSNNVGDSDFYDLGATVPGGVKVKATQGLALANAANSGLVAYALQYSVGPTQSSDFFPVVGSYELARDPRKGLVTLGANLNSMEFGIIRTQ